ncbi:MAG: hypothetical protein LBC27_03885 [Spirochaetaceae bacterium]|jgi:hypothetical protein|nr:hypothetical protein [Spirochaetaceae bacterium]
MSIQRFCGDEGYRKSFEEGALEQLGVGVDITKRIKAEFEVLTLRRGVERAFSRANRSLSKDYEIKTEHEENMFMISQTIRYLNVFEHGFSLFASQAKPSQAWLGQQALKTCLISKRLIEQVQS